MKLTKATLKRLIKEEISAIREMEEDDFDTMSAQVHEQVREIVDMMKDKLSAYNPETSSVEDLGTVLGLAGKLSLLHDIYLDESGKTTMKDYEDEERRNPLSQFR
jgi:hypothetical protein